MPRGRFEVREEKQDAEEDREGREDRSALDNGIDSLIMDWVHNEQERGEKRCCAVLDSKYRSYERPQDESCKAVEEDIDHLEPQRGDAPQFEI